MIEIPPLDMLDRDAEARLIHSLWNASLRYDVRFHDINEVGCGKSPVYTSIWESEAYPSIGIALVSIDTRSQNAGRYTYIEDAWKGELSRYESSYVGSGDYKVVRRYLISSDYSGEEKYPMMFAASNRRLIEDIFDPGAGLCRIEFCD